MNTIFIIITDWHPPFEEGDMKSSVNTVSGFFTDLKKAEARRDELNGYFAESYEEAIARHYERFLEDCAKINEKNREINILREHGFDKERWELPTYQKMTEDSYRLYYGYYEHRVLRLNSQEV